MYTHFKRCYLCSMCIHIFGTLYIKKVILVTQQQDDYAHKHNNISK